MKLKFKFNVPNVLTLLRFIMVPFAVWCAAKNRMLTGFVIYTAACATDVLDGFIARKFNLVTDAGKLLDPLADKVMIAAVLVTFTVLRMYPLWMLIIILSKELLMVAGSAFLLKKDIVVQANWSGKIAALLTHVSIGLAFLSFFYKSAYYYVMIAAIAATLISFCQYFFIYVIREYRNKTKNAPKND